MGRVQVPVFAATGTRELYIPDDIFISILYILFGQLMVETKVDIAGL